MFHKRTCPFSHHAIAGSMPSSCREWCCWSEMKRMQICFYIVWMQISRICEQKNLSCRVIRLLNLDFVTKLVVTAASLQVLKGGNEIASYHSGRATISHTLDLSFQPRFVIPNKPSTSCSSRHAPMSAYALRQTPTRYLVAYNKGCSIWSPDVSTLRNDLH